MPFLTQFELELTYQVNQAHIQALMNEKNFEYLEATRFDFDA